jgi:septation ring formation regulator EzrA
MKIIIKFTLLLPLSLFSVSSFAQSKAEVKTDVKIEKNEKSETPKEMKFTPETSYISNDKDLTYYEGKLKRLKNALDYYATVPKQINNPDGRYHTTKAKYEETKAKIEEIKSKKK